jgi:hypothetical protein
MSTGKRVMAGHCAKCYMNIDIKCSPSNEYLCKLSCVSELQMTGVFYLKFKNCVVISKKLSVCPLFSNVFI